MKRSRLLLATILASLAVPALGQTRSFSDIMAEGSERSARATEALADRESAERRTHVLAGAILASAALLAVAVYACGRRRSS